MHIEPKIVIFLFLFIQLQTSAQEYLPLNEMDVSLGQQTYGAPVINRSVTGEPLSVAGETFVSGVGVHAFSTIKINLNKTNRFTAKIGVNDSDIDYSTPVIQSVPLTDGKRIFYRVSDSEKQFAGVEGENGKVAAGSVIFKILHNEKEIYNSGVMHKGDAAKEVDLPLRKGVLELIVEDAGDGESGDHAVWLDPVFEYFEIAPVVVESEYTGQLVQQSDELKAKLDKQLAALPKIEYPLGQPDFDWLIDNTKVKAVVYSSLNGKDLIISNGLVARVFRVSPNLATIDYINQMTGESLLRAVSNEGTITIDGKTYTVGGLSQQVEYGYTKLDWVDQLQLTADAFQVQSFEVKDITDRMIWKRVRWSGTTKMPTGKELIFTLKKDAIEAKVHFEIYDGIPTISKWIEVTNRGDILIQLNKFRLEQLAMVEGESLVGVPQEWVKPNIHIETDYAFGGMQQRNSDVTTYWEPDPRYTSQANYPLQTPCLLEVRPPLGPETILKPGESLKTFRVWETPMDSYDKERRGMFIRKFYRTIAPWTTENPIFLHLTYSDEKTVKAAIDQCAEVGYEMVILSFGSGVNMEDESPENYAKFHKMREYANSKGIELGGYSLLSSRWISDEVDVINPKTGKRGGMIFGSSPCLCSEWGYDYFRKIKAFFEETGMSVFENDGSYPGNVCASTSHAYHNGLGDSQWKQYAQIQNLYKWMRSEGIYMNIPDFYVLSGSNKTGIGYREVNWSLPRERQLILGRQNIYDGLWDRNPGMCWTFTPLTQYHGGGAAATIEPLKDHLDAYENQMMQNYGSGIQSCYRGPRLYDAPETKELVMRVIDWYKKYRMILNSDLIHLRRPSGKDWDGFLHVNPELREKGLAMFFNPTNETLVREIELPLYYTGLSETAKIRVKEGTAKEYKISRDYKVKINVTIPANSYNWIVIEE
ncbi:NPCBM/NEW2 domain-containing protein [Maribellus sediminis]|uniref:NPCBM/NEW2 domain-containing protein n=1 Tax=Maribellus sediminis TaxID=2696285 RepID=UPI00197E31A9|nr:NPCBM/NEW2 domain-containing protein [Maribellus sediminis]